MKNKAITIIGAGLAGCEAAWQAARRDIPVTLYEMKPHRFSPAHRHDYLAELVCSNSFRSDDPTSAVGLLKRELEELDSLIMSAARQTAVPAGRALAVDRQLFSQYISEKIGENPLIDIQREEVTSLSSGETTPLILATGPLTSEALTQSLLKLTGKERLSFYDAIAPIIETESINRSIVYQKSRYDEGAGDYLNCPMTKEEYHSFITALKDGECTELHSFEKEKYFEGCLPIEVMCSRGEDTLRFGPMKPVGLPQPGTGRDPYAVVQLRRENQHGSHYNMVGFQTKLTYPEQKRIFSMIPGLENATFSRFGSVHRNTFICAPELLQPTLQTIPHPGLLIAGQLSGVEGYVESTAMGILAGINASRIATERPPVIPPKATALGALITHLTATEPKRFQPSNVNFSLFPPLEGKKIPKKFRGEKRAEIAAQALQEWIQKEGVLTDLQGRQDQPS